MPVHPFPRNRCTGIPFLLNAAHGSSRPLSQRLLIRPAEIERRDKKVPDDGSKRAGNPEQHSIADHFLNRSSRNRQNRRNKQIGNQTEQNSRQIENHMPTDKPPCSPETRKQGMPFQQKRNHCQKGESQKHPDASCRISRPAGQEILQKGRNQEQRKKNPEDRQNFPDRTRAGFNATPSVSPQQLAGTTATANTWRKRDRKGKPCRTNSRSACTSGFHRS